MNFWDDESLNGFNGSPIPIFPYELFQLSHLDSPFYDSYTTGGGIGFPETECYFDSSFASGKIADVQHQVKDVSSCKSSDFESPQHEETLDQLSYLREFDIERSRDSEELTENQNIRLSLCGFGNFNQFTSSSQQMKQLSNSQCNIKTIPLTHLEYDHSESAIPLKERIQWTKELHEKFVDCVDQLGGAKKATPKQLLQLMETEGLTLFHIKSHLQKFRISLHLQEFSKGKSERKRNMKSLIKLNPKIGKQLIEVVRQQLDIQSSLHEQLVVQKNLISTVEEQMRQLRRMICLRRRNSIVSSND